MVLCAWRAAGGRMIGKSVSNAVLDGWTGAFYQWEGDVKVRRVRVGHPEPFCSGASGVQPAAWCCPCTQR